MGSKSRKKFRCSDCKRRFPTENGVWTHISFNHPGSEHICVEIECPECHKLVTSEAALEDHINLNHIEEEVTDEPKPETEQECTVETEESPLPAEEPKCNTFKCLCSLCSKKFESENLLWTHIAFKHTKSSEEFSTLYICDTCKLVFKNIEEFNQHSQDVMQVSDVPDTHEELAVVQVDDVPIDSLDLNDSETPDSNVDSPDPPVGEIPCEDSSDISISDFVDDKVDLESQIILLSTKLTNELLSDRVEYLENKVLELQEYMKNLVDGLLRDTEPYVNEVSKMEPEIAEETPSKEEDQILEEFLEPLKKDVTSSAETNIFQDLTPTQPVPHNGDFVVDTCLQVLADVDRCSEEIEVPMYSKDEVRTRRKRSKNRVLPAQETEVSTESLRKSSKSRPREVPA